MEFETTVKIIGCLVIAGIVFAIPCLATLAFMLNWDGFVKLIFTILSIGMIVAIAIALYDSLD